MKLSTTSTRFGIFEVDLQAGELRRQGLKVKLQEQPFRILILLLERPNEVVTREELQKKLWPADTFVDAERGLNRAINKLREALADDADSPRFIETLPRRGYRFLASVETVEKREPEEIDRAGLAIVPPDGPHKLQHTVPPLEIPPRLVLPWAIAGALAILAIVAFWRPWHSPPIVDRPFLQLDLELGPDKFAQPAISQDGKRIAFVSNGALAIRRLDQTKTTRITGTEGGFLPFFSPNGQWLAFFVGNKLQKVAIDGGAPITLCAAASPAGGSWGDDDNIVAALNDKEGLFRIPAAGGMPHRLTDPGEDPKERLMHRWPQVLPGGKGVLFTAINASLQGSLRVFSPKDGRVRTLVGNSPYGRFLAAGDLVYCQGDTLFAAPFDVGRLELTAPAVPFVYAVANARNRGDFDVSDSGTLIYRRGTAQNSIPFWVSSSGMIEPVLRKAGNYMSPRLSPDGTRLALSVIEEGKQSLWVYDLARETWNRLTSGNDSEWLPAWSPDGEFLAFRSASTLAWTHSDGSRKVERLAGVSRNAGPWSFSPDGKWLAFWPLQPGSDLFTVPVERMAGSLQLGQPQSLLQQAGSKGAPAISPDGRWVAYGSDASGRFEVYVMSFSMQGTATGRRWQVSTGGGSGPVWSRNGGKLFYVGPDRRIQVVAWMGTGDSFVAEKPRFWSEKQMVDIGFFPTFDVAPDGKRVVALLASEDARPETILHVLLNVDTELERRAPHPH